MLNKLKSLNPDSKNKLKIYTTVIAAYILLQLAVSFNLLSHAMRGFLVPICAYIVMAVSLNLTVGIMGELSLGHAGFMSVGAYTGVVACAVLKNIIPFAPLRLALAIAVGGLCAAAVSFVVVVPVLRLQGDYLAIVTLAFGEIIKNIIQCMYVGIDANGLHISMSSEAELGLAADGKVIIRGPMGAVGIEKMSSLLAGFILVMITLFIILNLISSRHGRAIMALRDNRIAAQSLGISPVRYRVIAFCLSAMFAGMAGTLYAMNYSSLLASKFDFNTSILVLVFVVLGGMGNIFGSIIAAAALTILPELLRDYADYRMLLYAVVLILVMLVRNNDHIRFLVSTAVDKVKAVVKKDKKNEQEGDAQ